MTDTDDTATRLTRTCREPFRGAPAVAAGSTTRDRLRGPDFARVGPNLHLGAATEVDDLAWETIRVTAVMVDDEQAAARLLARVRRRLDAW